MQVEEAPAALGTLEKSRKEVAPAGAVAGARQRGDEAASGFRHVDRPAPALLRLDALPQVPRDDCQV